MAQLPPKVPTMAPNWPAATVQQQNMWVDEFLEFSSAKRSAQRRSASDSIAFLEVPLAAADDRRSSSSAHAFDRLDDEQLMSIFSDDISPTAAAALSLPATSSNTSSPSDHNSVNDLKPARSSPDQQQQQQRADGEVESSCKSETTASPTPTTAAVDPVLDPKRVKRILANRQSAQRSRIRKLQYISELERSVTSLQNEVSALSPRVAFLDHQRLVLNVDNSVLKQRIAALAQDKIFKDAHQEALKKEIERLRQVYHRQNLKKMEDTQQQQHQQQQPEQTQICTDGDELLD